jgi:hypothetical protein
MLRLAGVSASARPFVISGMALVMPPLPVLVPTPEPVRRNHSSRVRSLAPRAEVGPKVTYWLEPLSCRPLPLATLGVADASRDAAERLADASTAVTA